MGIRSNTWLPRLLGAKWFLLLLSGIFLAGGFCTRYFLDDKHPLREATGALCDALLIATLLAVIVDPLLKRTLIREATRDVFGFIFGYSLPEGLRDFVNDVILKANVVRRDCALQWEIRPKEGDKVSVDLTASFVIDNFTNDVVDYTHAVFSWTDSPQDVGSVEALYCQVVSDNDRSLYHLPRPSLRPDGRGYIRGNPLHLLPKSDRRREEYRLGVNYLAESFRDGLDQFTFRETTIGANVTVKVDNSLVGLIFSVTPRPSGSPEQSTPSYDPATKSWKCSWKLQEVFVPGETLVIRWQQPVLPQAAVAAPAAAPAAAMPLPAPSAENGGPAPVFT